MIFDDTPCALGEGALWHPLRQSFLWFDINKKLLFQRALGDDKAQVFEFDEHVSAMGWIDKTTLLIASETALFQFDVERATSTHIVGLEADNPMTRSNDGRADPYGGFWIGTMGKKGEAGAGAIYRYYRGDLRKLYTDISVSNSICFAPDGKTAYFCDTPTKRIMQQRLDDAGWPNGEAELFADVAPFKPDGSVVDSTGCLWNAQWGAHRVACYDASGQFVRAIEFTASQISCPAFGGADMNQLIATSARQNLTHPQADDGKVFIVPMDIKGQKEHQVRL